MTGATMRVSARIGTALSNQHGHLFNWVPVCMAIGIGLYFSLKFEPGRNEYAALVALAAVVLILRRWLPQPVAPLAVGVAVVAAGFLLAGARAHMVAEPVLNWRYYGPVEGRIVDLDRSASDALRITLDQVRLEDVSPRDRPSRARLSLHGEHVDLQPGQRVMTTAHLSPPQGPVEPGGFDFRRHAWFQKLGAVGYTRVPVLAVAPAAQGQDGIRVTAVRIALSRYVRSALPVEVGGFAAAVTTGDRSGMSRETLDNLRASNLAHLLAISGLHMGLLTGFVFVMCRIGFSAIPPLALRLPVRKLAAICALVAATIYLLLSGGNVATERAFIMVSVMFGAVLMDRRAISLRAVAVAAIIVLILRPDSLLSPGFQMSFSATTALVAVFGGLRDAKVAKGPKWARPVLAVLMSSAIAGLATAPIGAAHFNTMSHYGLVANLLSVPMMGSVVVPSAVLAALLAPFGLDWIALEIMGLGLRWILFVVETTSALDGALGYVASPPGFVLPCLAVGALWVILWQGRARWAGLTIMAGTMMMWGQGERPEVLVADSGGLIGVMTDDGRALSKQRGSGFVASVWLENDGDGVDQGKAANRWPGGQEPVQRYLVGDKELIHITGTRAARGFAECKSGQIIVSPVALNLTGACGVYDADKLLLTGSVAISSGKLVTSADVTGRRLWSDRDQ